MSGYVFAVYFITLVVLAATAVRVFIAQRKLENELEEGED